MVWTRSWHFPILTSIIETRPLTCTQFWNVRVSSRVQNAMKRKRDKERNFLENVEMVKFLKFWVVFYLAQMSGATSTARILLSCSLEWATASPQIQTFNVMKSTKLAKIRARIEGIRFLSMFETHSSRFLQLIADLSARKPCIYGATHHDALKPTYIILWNTRWLHLTRWMKSTFDMNVRYLNPLDIGKIPTGPNVKR